MRRIVLLLILAAAAAARLWYLGAGVPHAVGIDEPQVVDRALRILRTGEWNTHLFDYPSLVIYLHACVAILRFLWGAVNGEWSSLDAYSIAAVYTAGRFVAATIGVLTVWFTYRLGAAMASRAVGLLAAAQLAVSAIHVRESHFILTDVPMTALTTLAMYLAVRAMRLGTARAYGWAGAACGLAAAAKYTGGVSLVAVLAAWFVAERRMPRRGWTLFAAVGAAALAFFLGAPYTVLDMPAFLDGFAAQFSRFAAPAAGADPVWLVYLKHLSPAASRFTVPLAIAGMAILLWRPRTRPAAIPVAVFSFAFFYVIASHSHVFGRYALPLVPVLMVWSSAAALEIAEALLRLRAMQRPAMRPLVLGATLVLLLLAPAHQTVQWLEQQKRADTRSMVVDWMKTNLPKGTRVAVENSGPTYLETAGYKVVASELMLEHPPEWYRTHVDYLIISAVDLSRYDDYLAAGPMVLQIPATPQRWGPPIRVIALR